MWGFPNAKAILDEDRLGLAFITNYTDLLALDLSSVDRGFIVRHEGDIKCGGMLLYLPNDIDPPLSKFSCMSDRCAAQWLKHEVEKMDSWSIGWLFSTYLTEFQTETNVFEKKSNGVSIYTACRAATHEELYHINQKTLNHLRDKAKKALVTK